MYRAIRYERLGCFFSHGGSSPAKIRSRILALANRTGMILRIPASLSTYNNTQHADGKAQYCNGSYAASSLYVSCDSDPSSSHDHTPDTSEVSSRASSYVATSSYDMPGARSASDTSTYNDPRTTETLSIQAALSKAPGTAPQLSYVRGVSPLDPACSSGTGSPPSRGLGVESQPRLE